MIFQDKTYGTIAHPGHHDLTFNSVPFFFLYVLNCVSQSEREEFENEFKQQYEREKVLLTEENKKLTSELDKVSDLISFTFIEHIYILSAP